MVASKFGLRHVAAAAVTAIVLNPAFAAIAQAVSLNGAGATFPDPLYQRYRVEIKKKFPNLDLNYQAIGSGGGIRQTIAQTVDFGGSDAAMTDDQIKQVGDRGVILVPTAGGSVVPVYNLPGVSSLKLGRTVLPEIFAGRIKKWNDPKIAKDNPGVNLPNADIKTAVRADGSGTTFIFVNHLSAVSPYFRGRVGVGTAPKWTTNPIKGRGNAGVAQQVARTPNSLGYVEATFAVENKLQVAHVQTKKGEFILPSIENSNKALANITFPDNFRVFDGDPNDGYPITGLTWIMVYKRYDSAEKSAAIKQMVEWILTDGQEINGQLQYTRIPKDIADRAIRTVKEQVKP